jgi:hypothetical protein
MDSKEFIRYVMSLQYSRYSTMCTNMASHCFSVGKGDYGTAFKLADGHIAKIFKSHDRAYLQFLKMVMLTNSKHLPNIFCYDIYDKFGWVILEFLDLYSFEAYMNLSFKDITVNMSAVILGKEPVLALPQSLKDLAEEMRETAQGYCLDFRKENFALRSRELVIFDPYTNKTKDNTHLDYVEKVVKKVVGKK